MWFEVLLWGEIAWRCYIYSLPTRLLFMEANRIYFLNFLKILEVFCSFSGLRVNLSKSTLLDINTNPVLL